MKLIDFHKSCKKEYNILIKHFNILFYGYGNKKKTLEMIFPNAIHINNKFYTYRDIVDYLNGVFDTRCSTIKEIDSIIEKENILILYNFNFREKTHFRDLKKIKLVFTLERIDDYVDVEDLNVIFRDLTTFEDYDEDLVDIEINTDSQIKSLLKVVNNVPQNSRTVLKEILQTKKSKIDVNEVFELVKKPLMILSKNIIFNLISEFVDHDMLKLKDKTTIVVNIPKKYQAEILNNIKN
ncbi:hypothetical protein NGRA_0010 [Nosema granulosis]|uniref:Origin recognition complex subunit 2 n=1 Tax=Nosema granulosis TaxID=83296 RepID=A0A9P6H139_9MICR|nr:hypothetical protein NGRA_0010 [Nosema granulosis]